MPVVEKPSSPLRLMPLTPVIFTLPKPPTSWVLPGSWSLMQFGATKLLSSGVSSSALAVRVVNTPCWMSSLVPETGSTMPEKKKFARQRGSISSVFQKSS